MTRPYEGTNRQTEIGNWGFVSYIQKLLVKIAYFLLAFWGILTYTGGKYAKVIPFVFGGS
jgi:hypothetical protein